MKINFVVKKKEVSSLPQNDPDKHWNAFLNTNVIWSYMTYLRLRDYGYNDISYSSTIIPGAINVGTPSILGLATIEKNSAGQRDTIYVAIKADKLYSKTAQLNVVQSPDQAVRSANAYYITHWPQPGLVPRKSPNHKVRKIGLAGIPKHYAITKDRQQFEDDMKKRNLKLVQLDRTCWNDYSDIDIVLAVRDFNKEPITHKPPSKLINAWHAGVPVICNPEASYRWIGSKDENYLEVDSYESLLNAIDRLAEDRNLYESIVEKGREQGKNYTTESVTREWIRLFDGIRSSSIKLKSYRRLGIRKLQFKYDERMNKIIKNYYRVIGFEKL